jgi:hypothetical protein
MHYKHSFFNNIAQRIVSLKEKLEIMVLLFHYKIKILRQIGET